MAPTAAGHPSLPPTPPGRVGDVADFFGPQRTSAAALPPPEPLLRSLVRGVFEVLGGVREVEQLARWLSAEAFEALVVRANLAARARSARGVPVSRPTHTVLSIRHDSPADGVVEAVAVVTGPARTRAVAVRLEGLDGRWRATSLALL